MIDPDSPKATSHRPPWQLSLAARLATVWALLLGAAVGTSSWIAQRDARERLLAGLRQGIERDASEIGLRVQTWTQALQEDARSCAQSPLVARFLSSRGTPEETRWRGLMEDEFRAVFAGKPTYFQMRLLSAQDGDDGKELLRLDRKGGGLVVTPQDRLQSKANRPYFREALAMPAGAIYLSHIDLNRDFGEITTPHIPTMRAAVKISAGVASGAILVINADLRPLFEQLQELASPGVEVRLLEAGEDSYLLHPDPAGAFAADLGHSTRPSGEFPGLGDTGAIGQRWLDNSATSRLTLAGGIPASGSTGRPLDLILSLPDHTWLPELRSSQRRGIFATALAGLAGAAVAVLVSLPFTSRLRRLASALRKFDASGDSGLPLPDTRRDEVGIAIERFREMATKVREQVEQLRVISAEAQEANATKEAFLATMSHEIRTPMNSIIGLIRALEANQPAAHQQPILNSLRSSASNLMTLLNTALDHSQLREGSISYLREPFDAAALLREVGDALRPSALAKQLELEISCPDSLVVEGDAVRLRQVVNNLLNNAVKFTADGSVRASLDHRNGSLELSVTDTGPGIEPAAQTDVFSPFVSIQTGGATATATAGGAGLGLSVSREIVEQQGGEITLESEPDRGSTFSVSLPYPRVASASGSKPAAHHGQKPNTSPTAEIRPDLKILYVEDVLSNQEVMLLTLEPHHIVPRCATTGGEALRILADEEGGFDLVLVDLQLPDLTGDELARTIIDRYPELPVIAVTAQSSARTDHRLSAAGIRAVVIKPFTEEQLISTIAEHTGHRFWEALEELHPKNPPRAKRLAAIMAGELRAAARSIEELQRETDQAQWRNGIGQLQHKLKTAIARFAMHDLGQALDELVEKSDPALAENAIDLLQSAADELQSLSLH